MSIRCDLYRAAAVAALTIIVCSVATLANAGTAKGEHFASVTLVLRKDSTEGSPTPVKSLEGANNAGTQTSIADKSKPKPQTTKPQESVSFVFEQQSFVYTPAQ